MQRRYRRPPQPVEKRGAFSRMGDGLRSAKNGAAKLCGELAFLLPILFMVFCRERLNGLSIPEWNFYLSSNQYMYAAYGVVLLWILLPLGGLSRGYPVYALLTNLLPVEVVLFPTYFCRERLLASIFLGVGVLGSVCSAAAIYLRQRGRHAKRKAKYAMGRAVVLCMSILLLVPTALAFRSTVGVQIVKSAGQRMDWRSEIVENRYFDASVWQTLGVQEKLDVLQKVIDSETLYMGIAPQRVAMRDLSDGQTGIVSGKYMAGGNTLYIDDVHILEGDARECLDTMLHECRHAYQHSVVDLFDFSESTVATHLFFAQARQWRQEFAQNVASDPYAAYSVYYEQSIETDARAYAAERAAQYLPDEPAEVVTADNAGVDL